MTMSSSRSMDNATRNLDERNAPKSKRTPLPKFQLFLVFLVQFSEPISASVIYPFVNKLVRETGITGGDERKTGYYAGIIESTFLLAEALTVFQWGRSSDKYGRRPILLLGPLGVSLAILSFGLSKRFWPLVVYRCMQGIFNGNIGISKGVIGELTDSSNIADAMAIIPVVWSSGVFVGPLLGGLLSQPAESWPRLFGRISFFHGYPYFLPCAVASAISFVTALIAFLGLKETLPSAVHHEKRKRMASSDSSLESTTSLLAHTNDSNYGSSTTSRRRAATTDTTGEGNEAIETIPPLASLLVPRVVFTLLAYGLFAFVEKSCQVLQPLVYSTSPPLGGLGFDPYRIGLIMGTWGIINACVQLTLLGPVIRHFGPRKVLIFSLSSNILVLSLYPLLASLVKMSGQADWPVWAVLCTQLLFCIPGLAGYISIQIMIVDCASNTASLGALTGMAQAVGSGMRSFAPSIASSLFSISLERQLAGGNMTYLVLIIFALAGLCVGFLLPEM